MQDAKKLFSKKHPNIVLDAIPGHFVTPNSHINYYLDMSKLKARQSEAQEVAKAMAEAYVASTVVDTIVCMEGCEVIGAYLAEQLTKVGVLSMNAHKTIYITSPEVNFTGQILFRENLKPMIKNKHVLLLLPAATTGNTTGRMLDTIAYYGGTITGISAIFSAVNRIHDIHVNALFTMSDIADYKMSSPDNCSMCKEGKPIDALANGYGYSILR
ncbi:MAG: orotate phosphoribosyltransferase [Lachnospiraceae bacterium]|jgi:orotate phosphoribosyltransferase|nr:orotate phosphoribosyltransferase [Lachnospiraceae bacterium]